jgi:CBS domain-containing protein
MKISDLMTRDVRSIAPTESIADAARLMAELDVGALPVEDGGALAGIVTDRDIAVRGVAAGLHGGAPVLRVMTGKVISCREDDDVEDVLAIMGRQQIRRVPVCSEGATLIGMFALGDAAGQDPDVREIAGALAGISRKRGRHSQALHTLAVDAGAS